MHHFITSIDTLGNAEICIESLQKSWNEHFMLSQWSDNFLLVEKNKKGNHKVKSKIKISYAQANIIIKKLRLFRNEELFITDATWTKR
jgi:hypothetical protein